MNVEQLIAELKAIDWSFTGHSTNTETHTLHPYPAKFPPQIPGTILDVVQKHMNIESVLDPFGGSGTTALEAAKRGMESTTNDLNKITKRIVSAKLTKLNIQESTLLTDHMDHIVNLSNDENKFIEQWAKTEQQFSKFIPAIPNMEMWFHENTQKELAMIKGEISLLGNKRLQDFCMAVFSSIITEVSFQEEETKYRSVPREVNHGEAFNSYTTKLNKSIKASVNLEHDMVHLAKIHSMDMRSDSAFERLHELVITSPPYPNTTDYHLYHRHRNFWLDEDPVSFGKSEIGSHLRHQKEKNGFEQYMLEMENALKIIHSSMKSSGLLFMVVGNGVYKKVEYNTFEHIEKSALRLGFSHVITIPRTLPTNKRSFSQPARRLIIEQMVVLRKEDE